MFGYDTARPSMVTLDFGSSVVNFLVSLGWIVWWIHCYDSELNNLYRLDC